VDSVSRRVSEHTFETVQGIKARIVLGVRCAPLARDLILRILLPIGRLLPKQGLVSSLDLGFQPIFFGRFDDTVRARICK
jgi:hypothetical protein